MRRSRCSSPSLAASSAHEVARAREAGRRGAPPGLHLSIVVQTFTYSLGTGFYTAGSIIFFTIYVGLPSKQVALGMSIAALLAFVARIPIGMLSDRLGGRAIWRLSALLQALLFSSYPLVHESGFRPPQLLGKARAGEARRAASPTKGTARRH
jgi:hypothetical protein